jgi:DNA polymerase-3 subunit delta
MSNLGPAYLIHGDDHGAVAERRVRLRAVAEASDAETSVEALEGAQATPAAVAAAISALQLGVGRRVIVVDGVERWKDAEVKEHLVPVMAPMPPATTVALFASEDTRVKAPPSLHRAVKAAGGQVARENTLRPAQLPKWVREQGERLGLALDEEAATALVAHVGERRQRLLRELEKLALDLGPGGGESAGGRGSGRRLGAEEVELRAARSAQLQVYALADSLVEGALAPAVLSYLRLRAQGERVSGLLYLMASRLRQAVIVASRLEHGEPPAAIRRSLRMPSRAAERLIADARSAGGERLRDALGVLADLEMHTRGGPVVRAVPDSAEGDAALDEDTLALRAIETIAGGCG